MFFSLISLALSTEQVRLLAGTLPGRGDDHPPAQQSLRWAHADRTFPPGVTSA